VGLFILSRVRVKTGDGNLQGMVINRHFIPSQQMHLLVGHGRLNPWL
jgi:hypothetical protein